MLCPVCRLELGIERRADELVLTYSFKEWMAACHSRAHGDPVLCGNLFPTILEQLPEIRVTPLRSKPRATND
jgi:hypothetical protein